MIGFFKCQFNIRQKKLSCIVYQVHIHNSFLEYEGPQITRFFFGNFQVLPLTESGRSTPASQASVATVQDLPMSQAAEVIVSNSSNVVVVTSPPHSSSAANLVETPLIEVSEEEEFDFKSDNAPSQHSSSSTLNGGSVSSSSTVSKSSPKKVHFPGILVPYRTVITPRFSYKNFIIF